VKWSEKERECLQALRTSDYEQFKERNPDRLEGTCQWFLRHNHFKKWRQSDSASLLWVSADPGCGKSVLSKSLVDMDLKGTESRITCYFSFKDDNDIQKRATSALSALLHQLFIQKPSLIHHALLDYAAEGDRLPQLFHKLWSILIKAATDFKAGEVICVLDALDECEESGRYGIITALNTFYRKVTSFELKSFQLKFLVTSRPYLDIERRFIQLTCDFPTIRLQGEAESETISCEINSVIKSRVSKLRLELDLDDSEQSTLENGLLGMTHRTYLWVKLIFDVISNETAVTKTKLKRIISTLPSTVDEAYEAILSRIQDKNRPRAQKLLHIIVTVTRPLTLKEMNIALAIKDHHRSYEDLDLVKETGFETVVRNIYGLSVNVIDQKVYLIHQTAKEFLISKSHVLLGGWKYSLDLVELELLVARTCIAYLRYTVFQDLHFNETTSDGSSVKQKTESHSYFNYAAMFWATHYQRAQNRATTKILQRVLEICNTQSPRFRNWFHMYWDMVNPYRSAPQFTSSIMIGSYFGHQTVVELLLETGKAEADSKDSKYGRTPLSCAAENGREVVVKLLHETGKAEVDSKDSESGRTPLSYAAMNGREAVVKLLRSSCCGQAAPRPPPILITLSIIKKLSRSFNSSASLMMSRKTRACSLLLCEPLNSLNNSNTLST
jgi:ankyrin repeat domain-containing protein 50